MRRPETQPRRGGLLLALAALAFAAGAALLEFAAPHRGPVFTQPGLAALMGAGAAAAAVLIAHALRWLLGRGETGEEGDVRDRT